MLKIFPALSMLAATAFTAAPACGVAQAPPAAALPLPIPYEGWDSCNFDRVMVGPSGTEVAVWMNDRRSILGTNRLPTLIVVAGKMHDPKEAHFDRLFIYTNKGRRLLPFRWSPDGRLLVRVHEHEQSVLSFSADGGTVRDEGSIAPVWWRLHLTATSHGGVAPLRDPDVLARAQRIDGRSLMRGTATLGTSVDILAVRHPTLELVELGSKGNREIGLNAGTTRLLTAMPTGGRGKIRAAYMGAPLPGLRSYLPFQQPLFDLSSGSLVGAFGTNRILLKGESAWAGALPGLHQRLEASGRVILDASASNGALVAITRSANGDRQLLRLSAKGMNERPLCARVSGAQRAAGVKPPYPLVSAPSAVTPQLRVFALERGGREVLAPGLPIGIEYSLGSPGPRDLVIHFHGGPGGSSADTYFPEFANRLLAKDRDVLDVDYSGSQGGGPALALGLARLSIDALAHDIDSFMAWAAARRYRRIFVVGGSFGGIPALVAVTRHRNAIASAFLVGPLLKMHDPEVWSFAGGGVAPVANDTQRAYENAYLGGPEGRVRFARDLAKLVATAPLGPGDRFYFAQHDPISQPEHLPPGTTAPFTVEPNQVHAPCIRVPGCGIRSAR